STMCVSGTDNFAQAIISCTEDGATWEDLSLGNFLGDIYLADNNPQVLINDSGIFTVVNQSYDGEQTSSVYKWTVEGWSLFTFSQKTGSESWVAISDLNEDLAYLQLYNYETNETQSYSMDLGT